MKFSCDRCQARYQIPDEKVAGRRLRYTCRKCENAIVLDGTGLVVEATVAETPTASELLAPMSIPPSVAPGPGGLPTTSSAPKPAVAIATPDPRASLPPPRASAPPPRASVPPLRASSAPTTSGAHSMPELPVWHVAIAGSPVGPLRRSEVRERAEKGQISRASLAWREGLADWKPIAEIPELSVVVSATPTPSHRPLPTPVDEPPVEITPIGVRVAAPADDPDPHADESPPTTRTEVPSDDEPSPSAAAPAAVAPLVDVPTAGARDATDDGARDSAPLVAPRASRGPMHRVAIVALVALVVGAFALGRMIDEDESAGASATGPTANAVVDAGLAASNDSLAVEDVGDDSDLAAYAGVVDAGRPRSANHGSVATTREATTSSTSGSTPQASSDDGPLPMPTSAARTTGTTDDVGSRATTRPTATGPLDAAQISAVVRANRNRAQRCYERAATVAGSGPDTRLQVTVRIATSGSVSDVDIAGNDFGGVIACVERIVGSWQFPASTTGGQTTFTLLFSGG